MQNVVAGVERKFWQQVKFVAVTGDGRLHVAQCQRDCQCQRHCWCQCLVCGLLYHIDVWNAVVTKCLSSSAFIMATRQLCWPLAITVMFDLCSLDLSLLPPNLQGCLAYHHQTCHIFDCDPDLQNLFRILGAQKHQNVGAISHNLATWSPDGQPSGWA